MQGEMLIEQPPTKFTDVKCNAFEIGNLAFDSVEE